MGRPQADPAPAEEPLGQATSPPPARVVRGRVVEVLPRGLQGVAGVPIEAAFQEFYSTCGMGQYRVYARVETTTDEGGSFTIEVPETSRTLSSVFVEARPGPGWVRPLLHKLDMGRVLVPLEIPTRSYRHTRYVSVPLGETQPTWRYDHHLHEFRIELFRALPTGGVVLGPDGARVPHALVGCTWPYRNWGLVRRATVTDERGEFAIDVPASAPSVAFQLDPALRRAELDDAQLDDFERHPEWAAPAVEGVEPGRRDVVLHASAFADVRGWIVSDDPRRAREGYFDVEPLDPGLRHGKLTWEIADDGAFEVHGLQPGRWILLFRERTGEHVPMLAHALVDAPATGVRLEAHEACRLDLRIHGAEVREGEAQSYSRGRRTVRTQLLQPLFPNAPTDWWEDASIPQLPRANELGRGFRRGGRRSTTASHLLECRNSVLYVTWKDGSGYALVEDVLPSAGPVVVAPREGFVITGWIADFAMRHFLEDVHVHARRGHLIRDGTIDREGRFTITCLPPGAYEVALAGKAIYRDNPNTRTASVEAGTTDVVLHLR